MGRCWMLHEGNNTRPAETFCSTSPESFWQPASISLHRAQRWGQRMTLSSPACTLREGRAHWQTDWPLCISKCLHLFVPFLVFFCDGSFYGCFLMICAIMEHSRLVLEFCFVQNWFFFHLLLVWKPQTSNSLEHWKRYFFVLNQNTAKKTRQHLQEVKTGEM